jgi:Rieske Fe-S protein
MSCDKKKGPCGASFLHECEKAMSRRQALALAGSAIASGLLAGCGSTQEGEKIGACVGAGKGIQVPQAGSLQVGQAAIYPEKEQYFIIARDEKGFMAIRNYCTHAGGPMNIQPDKTYLCTLHASVFTFDGSYVSGPATRPLDHIALCRRIADGVLVADKGTILPDQKARVT